MLCCRLVYNVLSRWHVPHHGQVHLRGDGFTDPHQEYYVNHEFYEQGDGFTDPHIYDSLRRRSPAESHSVSESSHRPLQAECSRARRFTEYGHSTAQLTQVATASTPRCNKNTVHTRTTVQITDLRGAMPDDGRTWRKQPPPSTKQRTRRWKPQPTIVGPIMGKHTLHRMV